MLLQFVCSYLQIRECNFFLVLTVPGGKNFERCLGLVDRSALSCYRLPLSCARGGLRIELVIRPTIRSCLSLVVSFRGSVRLGCFGPQFVDITFEDVACLQC